MHRRTLVLLTLVCVVIAVLLPGPACASPIIIGNLRYQEKTMFLVPGNVTLIFNQSDTGHASDLTIDVVGYVPSTDRTIIDARSNNITYDYTFLNNTKHYFYLDPYTNLSYIILIDYSSIRVPESPMELLRDLLQLKNQTVQNLTGNITGLMNRTGNMTRQMHNLTLLYQSMLGNFTPLQNRILNLSTDNYALSQQITNKKNFILTLNTTIANRERAINDLRNPWSLGYTYGQGSFYYFNAASAVVTAVILIFIFFFYLRRQQLQYQTGTGYDGPRKGNILVKAIKRTIQPDREEPAFINKEIHDYQNKFLKDEVDAEVKDKLVDIKKLDPKRYEEIIKNVDKLPEKKPTSEAPPPITMKKKPSPVRTKEYEEPGDQNGG